MAIMFSSNPLFIFILFMALTTTTTKTTLSHARPLRHPSQDVEDDPTCWDALTELSSCAGEIVLFFLNGETYLGQSCCRAIETVDGRCSPVLISTLLGYTTMERDVLEGYCSEEHESTQKSRLRIESRSRSRVGVHGGALSPVSS